MGIIISIEFLLERLVDIQEDGELKIQTCSSPWRVRFSYLQRSEHILAGHNASDASSKMSAVIR